MADADSLLPELEELSELVVVSAGLLSPVDLSESPLLAGAVLDRGLGATVVSRVEAATLVDNGNGVVYPLALTGALGASSLGDRSQSCRSRYPCRYHGNGDRFRMVTLECR